MRRWLAAVALAACSPGARPPEPVRPAVAATPVAAPAPSTPTPTVHEPLEATPTPHAGAIETLALSPDGTTVISVDELGGVRLWPALDGTKEPRVVDMPRPEQLAIGRRPGGYFAAARDEAGGLYLAKLDAEGRQLSHVSIGAEPAVVSIAMTARGLLAWRADQTLALIDVDGVATGRLATEPAQRIISIAVSATRAVVLLERGGSKRQLRWLSLAPALAWGAWIDLDVELAGDVALALAPGGKRLAVSVHAKMLAGARVFDLANGKQLASSTNLDNVSTVIGFADDDHVALAGVEGQAWLDLTARRTRRARVQPGAPGIRAPGQFATGGGRAVTAVLGELALSTPSATEYLGYAIVSPRVAEVGPSGSLLVGSADRLLLLDKDLRGAAAPLAGTTGMVTELRWLGEDDWLVESTSAKDGTLQIAIVDAAGSAKVVRSALKTQQLLHYEPSTQLVTLSSGATSEVAHFDRKRGRLDRLSGIAKPSAYEHALLIPVSPALAHGTQLVHVTMRDRTRIEWVRDPHRLDKPAATATVDGAFAAADGAGHTYVWRNTPSGHLELAVYAGGKLLHRLPNEGALALWPDRSGTGYLTVTPTSVALYDIDGTQRWSQPLAPSQQALWLTDGALAITSMTGIARLDPATGDVTAARCGWRFGLAAKPHPSTPRVEPLCSQLRR